MNNKKAMNRIWRFADLLPLIIFSSLVPLIVYTKYVKLSEPALSNWMGHAYSPDIFSYYKMIVVLACAATALIVLIIKAVKSNLSLKFPFLLALIGTYAILVLLSAVFSDYPSIAFFGAPERYEGALVIISYLILFIYTINIIDTRKKLRVIFFSLALSSLALSIVAILQFFGVDIFRIPATMKLLNMVPNDNYPYNIQMIFSKYTSYATLYNPNFLAMYSALIFPVLLGFYAVRKTNAGRIWVALLIYICLLSAIGSSCSGFYYATAITMTMLLILSFPYIKKNVNNVVMLFVLVLGLLMITNIFTGNRVADKLKVISKPDASASLTEGSDRIYINDIVLEKNSVLIDTTEHDLRVKNINQSISAETPEGSEIPLLLFDELEEGDFSGNIYYFTEDKYRKNYMITTNDDYSVFAVKAGKRVMYFHMTDEGVRVPAPGNKLDIIYDVERNDFLYKRPTMFSGRGYIWSGALPLLKDNLFLGKGSDTFFLTYPQHDYIGKINMTGRFNVIIEKPHNLYLQAAHDSGILSLLILISIFITFYIMTLTTIIKRKRHGGELAYLIAVFCGITGYLISGILYDSAVLTAPVFWTLLGLGFVLTKPLSENQDPTIPAYPKDKKRAK